MEGLFVKVADYRRRENKLLSVEKLGERVMRIGVAGAKALGPRDIKQMRVLGQSQKKA